LIVTFPSPSLIVKSYSYSDPIDALFRFLLRLLFLVMAVVQVEEGESGVSSSSEDASEELEKVKKDSCKREEMRTVGKNGRKKRGREKSRIYHFLIN